MPWCLRIANYTDPYSRGHSLPSSGALWSVTPKRIIGPASLMPAFPWTRLACRGCPAHSRVSGHTPTPEPSSVGICPCVGTCRQSPLRPHQGDDEPRRGGREVHRFPLRPWRPPAIDANQRRHPVDPMRVMPARLGRRTRLAATVALVLGTQAALLGPAGAGGAEPAGILDDLVAKWTAFTGSAAREWSEAAQAVTDASIMDMTASVAVIHVRRACPTPSPGRAPDCATAATSLCNERGYVSGRELDLETGQVCRGTQLEFLGGPTGSQCKRKNWITQVACW